MGSYGYRGLQYHVRGLAGSQGAVQWSLDGSMGSGPMVFSSATWRPLQALRLTGTRSRGSYGVPLSHVTQQVQHIITRCMPNSLNHVFINDQWSWAAGVRPLTPLHHELSTNCSHLHHVRYVALFEVWTTHVTHLTHPPPLYLLDSRW